MSPSDDRPTGGVAGQWLEVMSEENDGGIVGSIIGFVLAIFGVLGGLVAVAGVGFASWKFMEWLRQRAPYLAMAVMMGVMVFLAVKFVPLFAPIPEPSDPLSPLEKMRSMLPILGCVGVVAAVVAHFVSVQSAKAKTPDTAEETDS